MSHPFFVRRLSKSELKVIAKLRKKPPKADGESLERWLKRHRGNRLPPFRALHVLYNLVRGLEAVHDLRQYHADVHSQNIMIKPCGVRFELKIVDFYDW